MTFLFKKKKGEDLVTFKISSDFIQNKYIMSKIKYKIQAFLITLSMDNNLYVFM